MIYKRLRLGGVAEWPYSCDVVQTFSYLPDVAKVRVCPAWKCCLPPLRRSYPGTPTCSQSPARWVFAPPGNAPANAVSPTSRRTNPSVRRGPGRGAARRHARLLQPGRTDARIAPPARRVYVCTQTSHVPRPPIINHPTPPSPIPLTHTPPPSLQIWHAPATRERYNACEWTILFADALGVKHSSPAAGSVKVHPLASPSLPCPSPWPLPPCPAPPPGISLTAPAPVPPLIGVTPCPCVH